MNAGHSQNGRSDKDNDLSAELLTAYALGQLSEADRVEVEQRLGERGLPDALAAIQDTRRLADEVKEAVASDPPAFQSSAALREAVLARFSIPSEPIQEPVMKSTIRPPMFGLSRLQWALVGGLACVAIALLIPAIPALRNTGRRMSQISPADVPSGAKTPSASNVEWGSAATSATEVTTYSTTGNAAPSVEGETAGVVAEDQPAKMGLAYGEPGDRLYGGLAKTGAGEIGSGGIAAEAEEGQIVSSPTSEPQPTAAALSGMSPERRDSALQSAAGGAIPQNNHFHLAPADASPGVYAPAERARLMAITDGEAVGDKVTRERLAQAHDSYGRGGEQYAANSDNPFLSPLQQPLSTFSIDVDTASYANMRRFLTGGSLPPPDAVRIEELVNYFRYDYPQPKDGEAFSVNMETAECPWNTSHLLLRVGLKGKDVERTKRPPSNLVFLLDVSGSMADEDKLPLLKSSMEMLTRELGEDDRVSIVTYAGEAGLRLPPTRGHEGDKIIAAIQSLTAGGSTNGSAGINIAYEQAAAYFVKGGTNRVILCTDGDLNVGITDDEALVELIKQKAAGGTFLTVLGFGQGNLKDAKMERLADNGNGLYAYIDSVREARKVLVEQLTGSTITIAKDVKIQIEFNPAAIASYRLIGYENRVLAAEDFNDDKKDAGEIGAGHTVTALYELVPVGAEKAAAAPQPANVDPLKYQAGPEPARGREGEGETDTSPPLVGTRLTDAAKTGELLTLKLRYKEPDGSESKLIEHPLKERGGKFNAASKDLQFAASVASFGMLLRGSEHRGTGNVAAVIEIAAGALGEDAGGYRAEFVDLARKAQSLGVK